MVHIPGHSAGSIGLFNEESRLLLSGDTIYADYAIGRYDLASADAGELKNSLELIAEMESTSCFHATTESSPKAPSL